MDYGAYLSPSRARKLPDASRSRSIASHSLRQAWHYMFDFCPRLLAMYPPSGKAFLDPFLDQLYADGGSLNWQVFLLILKVQKRAGILTVELASELMMAAAIRWTISDCSKNHSLFIIEKQFGISVFGQKAADIDQDKTFQVLFHDNVDNTEDLFFSVSRGTTPQEHENWEIVSYE